jgi:hypothetical protein
VLGDDENDCDGRKRSLFDRISWMSMVRSEILAPCSFGSVGLAIFQGVLTALALTATLSWFLGRLNA